MDEHAYMLWRRVFRDGPFTYDEFIAHPVFERALLNRAFVTTLLSEIYSLARPLLDHVSIESLRELVRAAATIGDINDTRMNAKDDSAIFLHLSGSDLWSFLTSKPWWYEDTPRHKRWIEDAILDAAGKRFRAGLRLSEHKHHDVPALPDGLQAARRGTRMDHGDARD